MWEVGWKRENGRVGVLGKVWFRFFGGRFGLLIMCLFLFGYESLVLEF